jgi:hypothetical protein
LSQEDAARHLLAEVAARRFAAPYVEAFLDTLCLAGVVAIH